MPQPLFTPRIVDAAVDALPPATPVQLAAAARWAALASSEALDLRNESQLEQEFNRDLVQDLLGYAADGPDRPGTMRVKQPVPGGTIVDVALGRFGAAAAEIVAPLELKGPRVALDRIMPGRAKTPVQQAWDYAIDAPGARWVLLSNMKELRLYAFGHGRQQFERFDLKRLDQPAERDRLRLLLGADRLLSGATADLLARSAAADRDITNQLYRDYKELRASLMQFVGEHHAAIGAEARIRIVQTILDRLLFVAFAEDKGLLRQGVLARAARESDPFFPRPKWDRLLKLFEWVDVGAPPHDIPRYNGGLFAPDPLIDTLAIPDHLVERFATIADYDFASEVSVTILGHIFEQSITDIENDKAAADLEAPPPTPKKKREGVVYTPDFITRFIVERTIGRHLDEIADRLLPAYGRRELDGTIHWRNKTAAEADYWSAYLDAMTALRIVDPACGSGAFLIAAFNFLHAEQKRVRDRLAELRPAILTLLSPNADVEIITNNLFGVDVNAESVEITRLALWLQTARRDRALESLDGNILHGNSLVTDPAVHKRPFAWREHFRRILVDEGGFDIVLGNPPYVRMELLKKEKPHLQQRFRVATDRADLYAYFFELGVELLKPGGRLGYISSSTFFRTGSGRLLREFLATETRVEIVVDFGELQVFEGVTTYPAIVTVRKDDGGPASGELRYLTVHALPDDLGKVFDREAQEMPRDRLAAGTWRFESDALDAIRRKMSTGRPALGDLCGAPMRGVVTGLNAAFILADEERDRLLAGAGPDDETRTLIKPFLIGEDLDRWRVERSGRWLIYTPRNTIDIDDYPALRHHLAAYKAALEGRAGSQAWFELQQPQAAYEDAFGAPKIVYSDITNRGSFSVDVTGSYLANTAYFLPRSDWGLVGYLNSRLAWFFFAGLTNIARGGYLRLRTEFVAQLPMPGDADLAGLRADARAAADAARARADLLGAVTNRLRDLGAKAAIDDWPDHGFDQYRALIQRRFRIVIPVAQRDEWQDWFDAKRAEAQALAAAVSAAEARIDAAVYRMFDLTPTEIAAVEDALRIGDAALSIDAYEAISAVEGIELTAETRRRLAAA